MYIVCIHRAVKAGVTIMNEVGVDPGIDHLLAMDCFDQVRDRGGKVSIAKFSHYYAENYYHFMRLEVLFVGMLLCTLPWQWSLITI